MISKVTPDVTLRIRAAAIVAGVALLSYANSFAGGFHYDDFHSLVDNTAVRSLTNAGQFFVDPSLFSADSGKGMYRPLLLLTFALNHSLAGYEVWTYHAANVLLHTVCALLVWRLARRLFAGNIAAVLAATLFAAHPLTTEPVNYISSRSELLASCFYLAAFCFYLDRRARISWWSVTLFAAGLLSKSTVITLPAALLLYELFRSSGKIDIARTLRSHSPYWAVALAYVVVIAATGFLGGSLSHPVRDLSTQLWTQVKALVYYGKLLALPAGLNVEHQFLVAESPLQASVGLSLALVASVAALAWLLYRRGEWLVAFGITWAVLILMPSSVMPLNMLVNEHRLYLLVAILALVVTRLTAVRGRRWMALAIPMFAAITMARNRVWADELTLWSDAVAKAPQMYRAQTNLGKALQQAGDSDAALTAYHTAIAIDDRHGDAYNNVAVIHQMRGELDEAIRWYHAASERYPHLDEIYQNLADAYTKKGDAERGLEFYEKALQLDDGRASTWNNYGQSLLAAGHVERAERAFATAVELNPSLPEDNNLGNIHSSRGDHKKAVRFYQQALELNPSDSAAVYANLGDSFRALGQLSEARAALTTALALGPVDARFHYYSGRLERRAGDLMAAAAACERAVALRPHYSSAMLEWAEIEFERGDSAAALALLQRVAKNDSVNSRAWFDLGMVYEQLGRTAKARQAYERFLDGWRGGDGRRQDVRKRLEGLQ